MHALVDSHAHLDHDAFDADRAETLGRAAEAGVVRWHLSLSHDGGIATAFVVAEA